MYACRDVTTSSAWELFCCSTLQDCGTLPSQAAVAAAAAFCHLKQQQQQWMLSGDECVGCSRDSRTGPNLEYPANFGLHALHQ